jgi:endoglucanase
MGINEKGRIFMKLKKMLSLFMVTVMTGTLLVGCGKENEKDNTSTSTETSTPSVTEAATSTPSVTETATSTSTETSTPSVTEAAAATEAPVEAKSPTAGIMRDITTMQLVYDMGIGINLGNTFDATGDWINSSQVRNFETAWGSPVITEKIIKAYADAGFRTMRIPVTWSNMLSSDYVIDTAWMDRIQQIVDWVTGNGMYAIVNLHHDSFIGELFPTDEAEGFKKYEAIWSQISERFKDYSDYLIFESMNEPGFDAIWNQYGGTQKQKERAFDLINRINQRFVDLVRASGSNNAERHLLISTYYTNIGHANNGLTKMPDDPMGRCAISVHYYTPWTWVALEKDESWGKARWEWGTPEDYADLNSELDLMKTNYVDKGIPVIIGEYCMCSKKEKQYSDLWEIEVTRGIYERGMCPVYWDVQGSATNFFDRKTLTWGNPEVLAAMQEISATRDFTKVYEN